MTLARTLLALAAAAVVAACAVDGARDPEPAARLAAGPVGFDGSLPSWHPPVDSGTPGLPEGHPPLRRAAPALPEGHPPIPGWIPSLPEGHPECPAMGGADSGEEGPVKARPAPYEVVRI